ncbi:hypothetical protein [Enterobacteriaceae endosymbiont of Donacia semicuprea]|uniref:hypothetical protein n=1 Tax=Enterobacteriaceae endosymbiont of Donacia semicuprea TaxID=2675783 RepID=UPI0014494631|nr:hypothetical protein [Enterobacteriaceae endosymbiont of Donacia semicuprea]QJC32824.1 hypothetical protein GJT91_00705 [Enterobacteriaceae endosymbiont of Donacia semicuprea]
MRNNKLLLINKIFQKKHYSSHAQILYKIYIHTNILIKINKFIKKYLPIELYNYYNIKNFQNNILILELYNSNYIIKFLSERDNLIFFLKKNIIPSLKKIDFKINPVFFKTTLVNNYNYKYHLKKNILSKYSAKLLTDLSKKSSIKLRFIIQKFIKLAKNNI